ncbi:GNAT family N-acetyltransferase [Cytobacillus depressus]|uniref:GNAT family N-acetyltransferase n=1 Tax=Cytobacillus depressus TaxID=1602942 RepID=A0A6L3VBT6_9BACI|nr:GNAT family N-acetyltransferase [Cytobacillus depressus]KAB2338207.1 GNAT family N-acetyltransferase [Cytobacillus depressus]
MGQMTNSITIVEYNEGLAKGIAKMWNLSRDSWGGDKKVHTEESVKAKEASSENIILYLAMDGDEVVGYCSLSEYKDDTGSLYIPLLNVRPDYHGKKIGKVLVLKAVEKTVELGWPRLDLYTWPGNVKAVPLYKKCGFFWEDRDDSTHLMNFIPAVLNTPLLKPLFSKLNWYKNSIREIKVKPDGLKERGFTFYEYVWKNEHSFARVRFERTGRGISFIETADYLLELVLSDHEVIEEETRRFEIRFVNKSKRPISLKVKGNQHERAKFILNEELIVVESTVISGDVVFLKGEEPSLWKKHPYLSVNVLVNGEECELRLGVFPKQPAKITAKLDSLLSYIGKEECIELEMENNLRENAEYEICFSKNNHVQLKNDIYQISLKKAERKLVKVPLVVNKFGFYQPHLQCKAIKEDGSEIIFEDNHTGIAFKGFGEKFGGESKDYWHIYNGLYQVNIRKMDYLTTAGRTQTFTQPYAFFVPKLGKPFSTEFSKLKPENVEWHADNSGITITLTFQSKEYDGLFLSLYTTLFAEGLVKRWVTIENKGEKSYSQLFLNQSFYHEKKHCFFPLENEVVEFSEGKYLEFGDIPPNSITGNWYFSNDKEGPIGFSWSNEMKVNPNSWQFQLENELCSLDYGEKKEIEPCYLSIGAFRTWQEQEAFAKQQSQEKQTRTKSELAFLLTENSPITSNSEFVSFQLKSFRTNYLNGHLDLKLNDERIQETAILEAEEKREYEAQISIKNNAAVSILTSSFTDDSKEMEFKQLLLKPTGEVHSYTEDTDHLPSYILDNGVIKIKASPEFYPGIYSLALKEQEWLDSSFPNLIEKSWWNPWAGGLKTVPSKINTFSLLKESSSAEFKDVEDINGNRWRSLALHTKITENAHWKGLQYTQYFALLPGIPVLAYFVSVDNAGGNSLIGDTWRTDLFIKGDTLEDLSAFTKGAKKFHVGMEEQLLFLEDGSFISSQSRKENMYLVNCADCKIAEGYMNKDAFQVNYVQKAKKLTEPGFIFFDQRSLSKAILDQLRQIEFQI